MIRCQIVALVAWMAVAGPSPAGAQAPVTPPEHVRVNGDHLAPHRVELRESTERDGGSALDAWVYLTFDHMQSWDDRQVLIQWMALTWNGTGIDGNVADRTTLGLRSRVTPLGIPAGVLVESHYFGGAAIVEADPDGEVKKRPVRPLGPGPTYNVILWPYVFASLEGGGPSSFVLPGYSAYSDRPFFYRVDREADTAVVDADGTRHAARVFVGRVALDRAAALDPAGPDVSRKTRYLVSDRPPYFLGKEDLERSADGQAWAVTKRWTLGRWQGLAVSPAPHVDEILLERQRRLKEEPQALPWKKTPPPLN